MDNINHPAHYTKYKTEVIDITRYLPFCLGNVVKYVLRAPYKGGVEDCNKALQYLDWCDVWPVAMFLQDGKMFMRNLTSFRTELAATNNPVEQLQYQFLTNLEDTVYWGGGFAVLRGLIKQLRQLLEEKDECS